VDTSGSGFAPPPPLHRSPARRRSSGSLSARDHALLKASRVRHGPCSSPTGDGEGLEAEALPIGGRPTPRASPGLSWHHHPFESPAACAVNGVVRRPRPSGELDLGVEGCVEVLPGGGGPGPRASPTASWHHYPLGGALGQEVLGGGVAVNGVRRPRPSGELDLGVEGCVEALAAPGPIPSRVDAGAPPRVPCAPLVLSHGSVPRGPRVCLPLGRPNALLGGGVDSMEGRGEELQAVGPGGRNHAVASYNGWTVVEAEGVALGLPSLSAQPSMPAAEQLGAAPSRSVAAVLDVSCEASGVEGGAAEGGGEVVGEADEAVFARLFGGPVQ
jgi:hypothetical protein